MMAKVELEHALLQLSQGFNKIPFNSVMGLKIEKMTAEEAVITFNMKEELIGNFFQGILHGGVISAVLDMTGGTLIMANALSKQPELNEDIVIKTIAKCSTINLEVNFLNPGRGKTFTAEAHLLKSGNKIAFTRIQLHNDEGDLIASGSGTYVQG